MLNPIRILSPKLRIEVCRGNEAIEQLAGEWEALTEGTEAAAFASPYWHLAWADAFSAQNPAIITARDGSKLVGVFPVQRTRTDARGLFFHQVAPFTLGDYQPPIVDPNYAAEAIPQMLEAAFTRFGRCIVYWWPHIPAHDPGLPVLLSFLKERGLTFTQEREPAPRLRLDGADFATAEKIWRQSHRTDVRRQRKRLAAEGPVSLWQPETLAEAESVLEEFFRVYDEKWLSQGYPGRFQDAAQRLHYHSILRRMWGRGVHFSTIRCGEAHISYHFGFFANGWIQWYRPTYRPQFHGFSPGKIHIAMVVEEACRLRWKGIDFLLGADTYKDAWKNDQVEVVNIIAGFRSWSPSYFWFTEGKPFLRDRLQRQYLGARAWLQERRKRS